jgi:hypothetical protein
MPVQAAYAADLVADLTTRTHGFMPSTPVLRAERNNPVLSLRLLDCFAPLATTPLGMDDDFETWLSSAALP